MIPIAAGGYDLVHFEFSGIAAQVATLLPLLRPAKLVVSCRGAAEQIAPFRDPTRAATLRMVFNEVDIIHCVSEDMARTVTDFGAAESKILVNRPAVDTARWFGVSEVSPSRRGATGVPLRVLSVGRLHWKKGFDDAIRAVSAADRDGLKVHYRIAGEGPEREKLSYLLNSLDVRDNVELLGWKSQQQVIELMKWADVFLLPSLSEGISNSALEAMAAGLPVVSTNAGGMSEAIESPLSGQIVNIGDHAEMVRALKRLADPTVRQAMGQACSNRARSEFDLARQIEVFRDAYHNLLSLV